MDKAAKEALLQYGEHMFGVRDFDTTEITISCDLPMLKAVDVRPEAFVSDKEARVLAKADDVPQNAAIHYFLPDGRLNSVENTIWTGMTAFHAPPSIWDDISRYKGYDASRQYKQRCMERFVDYVDNVLRRFEAVCSTDFSMLSNWSDPTNLYNVQRNRMIGRIYQNLGLTVIPTLTWSSKRMYEYAFLGVEPGGTYAISSIGCNHNNEYTRRMALSNFRNGVDEIVKRLSPTRLIVYGSGIIPDADYGKAEVLPFQNRETVKGNEAKSKKRGMKNGKR